MAAHDDLPLFAWNPPACVVLPFPSTRRLEKIRDTARLLMESTEKQAAHYRRTIFPAIEAQFLKNGVSPERAAGERVAFEEAVANEVRRRVYGRAIARPDGGGVT